LKERIVPIAMETDDSLYYYRCKTSFEDTPCPLQLYLRKENPVYSSPLFFLATDPEVLALPDFLRSSGSGTGSSQPGEYN
jgi:hypothetical protein